MSPIDDIEDEPLDDSQDDSLDEPTEEELHEAEALARALDRGTGTPALPEDALETAALLRYANGEGELASDRQRAILEEVFATAKPVTREAKASAWQVVLKWLVPGGVLAAAAVWAIVALSITEPSAPTAATALPAPSLALLRAQARAAGQPHAARDGEGEALLASAMSTYRGEVYAALGERYSQ